MQLARERVLPLEDLAQRVRDVQRDGRVVGLCHGCFDVLHAGHVRHFEAAARLVDALVVTLTPDRFVNKGPNRPVFPEAQRAEVVAGLKPVDSVAVNRWPSAVDTLRLVRPDVFLKGQEYETKAMQVNPNFLEEKRVMEELGGRIAFTYEWTSSSTAAVKRMQQAPG